MTMELTSTSTVSTTQRRKTGDFHSAQRAALRDSAWHVDTLAACVLHEKGREGGRRVPCLQSPLRLHVRGSEAVHSNGCAATSPDVTFMGNLLGSVGGTPSFRQQQNSVLLSPVFGPGARIRATETTEGGRGRD